MQHRLSSALAAAFLVAAVPALAPAAAAQGQIDRDHVPSELRVDRTQTRQSDLDGNQVRTTIFNFGLTGRTGDVPDEIPYEWPKNTRRHYIALTGLFVGAEVTLNDPASGRFGETQAIFEVPNYRRNTNNPNKPWNLTPIQGYVSTADEDLGIARSDRPETWPAFWPGKLDDPTDPGWSGSWNGYFGKDVFNADQEFYYRMGDDTYDRYPYFPDSTDLSRGGLGLLIDSRVLAWSQILIEDAVFILHSIKNDGTEDLDRVGVSLWVADLIGGNGDAADDDPEFDLLLDVAFLKDSDGQSPEDAFAGVPVEAAFALFLETPGNGTDRIDNDGDGTTGDGIAELNVFGQSVGEPGGPIITEALLVGECPRSGTGLGRPPLSCYDGIDNNGNGLIDETEANLSGDVGGLTQRGVGFADYIDNDGDGEPGSPVVTAAMVALAGDDAFGRWPVFDDLDADGDGELGGDADFPVHLVGVGRLYNGTETADSDDVGKAFRDGIDNDADAQRSSSPPDYLWEPGSPAVSQEMVAAAADDAPYFRYRVPGTDIVLYDVRPDDVGLPYADGVDNDGDGAVDEGIDEGIDEMIDERRDDGIDNDGDWRADVDDVGLDGAAATGDFGERDGEPTSGAGTDLPGEANIDVTDVSESDQIGITNVRSVTEGDLDPFLSDDNVYFGRFLIPGQFSLSAGARTDLVVSSGLFPLRAGQTERVSLAVVFGDVSYPIGGVETFRDLLNNRNNAQEAYEADYRFAQAPTCPNVRAVAGNGTVTLYWDREAEDSFDSFIADLNNPALDPNDFEGYKVYRATDPAFLDARQITDGFGNITFLRPRAQFDLINGNRGFEGVVPVNGTAFNLGNDARDPGEAADGLAHSYTDSTAINGTRYFYAVTSYDFGAPAADIPPTECSIEVAIAADGEVERLGPNVVEVTPSRAAAGYAAAEGRVAELVQGFTTAEVSYEVVDQTAIRDGARYRVTFDDTLIVRNDAPDTLRTVSYSLLDVTDDGAPQTLIRESDAFREGIESLIADGFRLNIDLFPNLDPNPDPREVAYVIPVDSLTGWSDPDIFGLSVTPYTLSGTPVGPRSPFDYSVEITPPEAGDRSYPFTFVRNGIPRTYPEKPTNVRVFKMVVGADGAPTRQPVPFAAVDLIPIDVVSPQGTDPFQFEADLEALGEGETDRIILFEDLENGLPCTEDNDDCQPTWTMSFSLVVDSTRSQRSPRAGDEAEVVTRKPWPLERDVFEFTTVAPQLDREAARQALDDVRVVPNPYVVTSGAFERQNTFSTGRGPRVIRFTGVPPECTLRIFTVSGRLVRTIERRAGSNDGFTGEELLDGAIEWDLLGEGRLAVSYGVYLYHLDAPGIGERTGTFAIVK